MPSPSRKTVVTSALKGVQICPYFRAISLQYAQLLSGYRGVKLTTRRRSSQVIWSIGGRRSDVGHPKAFLTGHMEHWWSPERQVIAQIITKNRIYLQAASSRLGRE